MRRALFVTHYSNLYGANRSLLCLIDGLEKCNIEPYVLAPKQGPITEELSERNVSFYTIPFKRWMAKNRWKAPARLALNLSLLPFLVQKARDWEIDFIHTNSSVTPIGALLAEVLRIPHIWHVREFGDLDFNLQHDWGRTLFRFLMSRASAAIAVSQTVHDHVLSDIHAPSFVVYNGVIALDRLEKIRKADIKQKETSASPYTFAIVGQLSPAKGQGQALRALHRLKQNGKEVRLLIAGSGPERHVKSLQQLRESLKLEEEASFLGYVENPFEVYQQADAVLMCSSHEAMGRVTAEAMAIERPVIGYNSAGTAEIIEDNKTGFLYNGTTDSLAECMTYLLDHPEHAQAIAKEGHKKAKNNFLNEVYVQKMCNIIEGVA